MKMETQHSKIYGMQKKVSKREVYSYTGFPQLKKKNLKQPNLPP